MFARLARDAPLSQTSSSPTCSFNGNPDIYGPGIRIGIYTQMLAAWFANYFLICQVTIIRDTVSIFSLAILIVAIIFAANPSSVHAIEAFLLLQILFWSSIMGIRGKSSYTSTHFSSSVYRKFINETIHIMILGLHVWFWWGGVDKMIRGGEGCGTWIMYVVKVDLYDWPKKVLMALNIFALLVSVYFSVFEGLRGWVWWKTRGVKKEFEQAVMAWNTKTREEDSLKAQDDVQEKEKEDDNTGNCEGCSVPGCPRCSAGSLSFNLDREATLVPCRNTQSASESMSVSRRSSEEIAPCKTPKIGNESPRPQSYRQHSIPANFVILIQVYQSQSYLRECISAAPYHKNTKGLCPPLLFLRSIFTTRKNSTDEEGQRPASSPAQPSLISCHIFFLKSLFTFNIPAHSMITYSHLMQARIIDPFNGPFQIRKSLTCPSPVPQWPIVSLASSLLLSSSNTPKKIWFAWYYAIKDLCVHVFVIAQVELTLRWNNVTGLTNLWGSVGQLIPFIIGVAGLGLVVSRWFYVKWGKKMGKRDKDSEDDEEADKKEEKVMIHGPLEIEGISERTKEGWERWKKEYEKSMAQRRGGELE